VSGGRPPSAPEEPPSCDPLPRVVPELDAPLAPEALPVCEVPEDEPALTEPLAEVPVEAEPLEVEPLAMPALDDPLDAPLTPETPPADEPAEPATVEAPESLP